MGEHGTSHQLCSGPRRVDGRPHVTRGVLFCAAALCLSTSCSTAASSKNAEPVESSFEAPTSPSHPAGDAPVPATPATGSNGSPGVSIAPSGSAPVTPSPSSPLDGPASPTTSPTSGASGQVASGGSGGTGSMVEGSGGTSPNGPSDPSAAGGSAGNATVSPSDGEPGPRFVGRFDIAADGSASFEWSGSGVVARFEGTGIAVTIEDGGDNQFAVVVDGQLQPTLGLQPGTNSYPLAAGLEEGQHEVELYRRTEASFGTSRFASFSVDDGRLLAPPPAPGRTIELIGDSISCGYGNEGTSTSCGFSADTENHYATYGAIAARALNADLITVAWSGKGVVYNYDTDTVDPLPALYDRTLPTVADSLWDFSTPVDAVVINLGTNDFSTDDDPSPQLFQDRYVALLEHLRDVYPEAFILCTVGPLLSGSDLQAARDGIDAAIATRATAGDDALASWEMNISNDAPGCDWHPSLATHQAMADALVAELKKHLAW